MPSIKAFHFTVLAIITCLFSGCGHSSHAEVKKAKIGEVEIAYYTRGSGEPLLMIMGFRGTMAIWDPGLLDILEKKYQLILFDNRGVGLSTDTQENKTTISQMANDAAMLVQFLGIKKTNVLGWSMGSRIALDLAIEHPEIVNNIILCSPNPGGKHQAPRNTELLADLVSTEVDDKKILSLLYPDNTEGHVATLAYIGRLTKAIIEKSVPYDLEVSKQTIQRQVDALIHWGEDEKHYESLPNIKSPALVAGGLSDVIDPPKNVTTVASQLPFAWTAYFANAGHAFLSQDYKHFGELVILFLESNTAKN